MEPTVSEIVGELDALGLIEPLRDDRGDVVMRPARDGTPQVVWVARRLRRPAEGEDG